MNTTNPYPLPSQPVFQNPTLFLGALVHRSFLNENSHFTESNERLEFLGDAVLELWCSQTIFHLYPQFPEGQLTALRSHIVKTDSLARTATRLSLGDFLLLSHGEEKNGGRQNPVLLANTFEAIVGALYLDQGFPPTSKFLDTQFLNEIKVAAAKGNLKSAKSLFQEVAQAKTGQTPHYRLISQSGPPHQKVFTVAACLGNKTIATGHGNSKQQAEEEAGNKALSFFHPRQTAKQLLK